MERITRLAMVIGTVALLAANLAIGRAWVGMTPAATAAFASFSLLALVDRRAVALVLAASCLLPPLIWFTLATYGVQFWVVWMAALLGALLPRLLTAPSRLPPLWRASLMTAALAVLVGAPLVVVREIDFNPALLGDMPFAVLSGLPRYSAEWTLLVALVTLTGILWFDWLSSTADLDVETVVLRPLAASLAVCAAVSVYQMFVDVTFLNETVYGGIGRAGGTMFDANVAGVLAAMGIGLAFALADGEPRRPLWLTLIPLYALAVWASGSRTGFAAAAVVLLVSGIVWRRGTAGASVRVSRRVVFGAVAVIVAVTLLAVTMRGTTTVGPLQRFARLLPGASGHGARAALVELWNRNGYGAAATYLIERHPLVGIGLGSFHQFGPTMTPIGVLPPDNAQNWLRHQLVELGVLGSLGWLIFMVGFGLFVIRGWRTDASRRPGHLRGMLAAIAVVSLFGMPTQEVVPLVLFWTTAGVLARERTLAETPAPLARWALVAMAIVTIAFGAITWQQARGRLRVPVRARQIGWPYSYGFYWPEPDGAGGTVRWMAKRASALIDVPGRYLRVSVRAPLPNVERDPVRITISFEGRVALDTQVRSGEPVTATFRMRPGMTQVLVDLGVSRTVRPGDVAGAGDDRELGALVSWESTSAP